MAALFLVLTIESESFCVIQTGMVIPLQPPSCVVQLVLRVGEEVARWCEVGSNRLRGYLNVKQSTVEDEQLGTRGVSDLLRAESP
jgi:hypothetical protein